MTRNIGFSANKYRPSLPDLMNLCATNYALSLQLLADKEDVGERRHFFISTQLAFVLSVKEVTKYTSLIYIVQEQVLPNSVKVDYIKPQMQIRLYHDARAAEVISSQGVRHVKPRYDYPNKQMHQPDEKLQTNQFLKEWLQMCLEFGQVQVSL